jgi:peptide deformylase
MSTLKIICYPDNTLKTATTPVVSFDMHLQKQVDDLFDTMYEDNACGLAANQVGLTQSIFVMDASRDSSAPLCFINPKIIAEQGIITSEEGCMSFPGVYTKVKRSKIITVRFQNPKGELQELTLEGLASHCVQHESDHLNGILFIERLSGLKKSRLLKKLAKINQFQE